MSGLPQGAWAWGGHVLVVLGTAGLTLAVVGVVRLPRVLLRVHAAGMAVFLGVVPLLLASVGTAEPRLVGRAVLVAAFVVLTAPLSAHAVAVLVERGQTRRPGEEVPPGG